MQNSTISLILCYIIIIVGVFRVNLTLITIKKLITYDYPTFVKGGDKVEKAGKIIVLPFLRNTKIESAVNTLNVAVKDVEENYNPQEEKEHRNIVDEFSDIINNIHGESQLIEMFVNNNSEDLKLLHKGINSIKQNCLKLTKALNNMVELKRIEEKQFYLNLFNVNIVEVVDDIVFNVSKKINKSIIFDTDVEEMFILCDVEKLQKLFLTILSIVIRYTDEEIQVNIKTTENKIDISIIFQNKCSRLLNYFKDKMDNLFYKSIEDISIGLHICKKIIELHSGNIQVKNNDGICFSVTLPVNNSSVYYLYRNEKTLNRGIMEEQVQVEFSDHYDYINE